MKKINLPIIYSQLDARWGSEKLGYNINPQYNIYNYGCLITCLAMVCEYYGIPHNPSTINKLLKDKGGFSNGGGLYIWGSLNKAYGEIKEKMTNTPSPLSNLQISEIRASIDQGMPVMVQIDVNPKTVDLDMHYVLIIGYNPSDENDFIIADPIGGVERSLKYYLGWFRPSARKTIEQYTLLQGTPKFDMKDKTVDFDDAEGKRHTVGWYVYEWYVEKREAQTLAEISKEKQKKLERVNGLLADANAEIVRKEHVINDQETSIGKLESEVRMLKENGLASVGAVELITMALAKLTQSK